MTKDQVQSIESILSSLQQQDINDIVSRIYPGRQDLENILISKMKLNEFISILKKVLINFQNCFENQNFTIVLPFTYTNVEIGQATVQQQFNALLSNLNSNNLPGAENALLWLASYQISFGFFEKVRRIQLDLISDNLLSLSEKLKLIQTDIENKLKETTKLTDLFVLSQKEATSFIQQKKEELTQITTNLSTTNTQTSQITTLLNQSTEQSTKISSLLTQHESSKKKSEEMYQELVNLKNKENKALSDALKTVNAQIENLEQKNQAISDNLKFVESKRAFFDERIKYLEELIGREVGASLFETFKQRKMELTKPVLFWRWAVPIMAIATIIWIFFLFHNLPMKFENIQLWWQMFGVNSIKTIPAIFLLLFSISQYRKERNFQEEYAFKSAVALTINAYAQQLKSDINRDNLILEAIQGVYRTPIEERYSSKIKTKPILENLKIMTETLKDLAKAGK